MSRRDWLCYTDGSAKTDGAKEGGWGFSIRPPSGEPLEGYGKATSTLAKTMEYRAVAEALDALPAGVTAVVFSDNLSLVENLGKKLGIWSANSFGKVDPVILESVKRIDACITDKNLKVRFEWIRSHSGNAGNERANELATRGTREARAEQRGRGSSSR
jgi:ribonuclease HI